MHTVITAIFLAASVSGLCKSQSEIKQSHLFRNLCDESPLHVKQFYLENHKNQKLSHVLKKKKEYSESHRKYLSVWDALEILDSYVDESDPDISLPQSAHAFQTAEALRKDGHPRWLILTGLLHDFGKMLGYFGEPQWNVVGDTFPVGCAFDPSIVFHDYFQENDDLTNPLYQTKFGIYKKACGFDSLHMSFGHDEYLYQVMKPYLPEEALYIIRFHSFYPAHKEGAYDHFMNDKDRTLLKYLQLFSRYDLYSKENTSPNIKDLMPYYKELVKEFLPDKIWW